MRTKYIHYKKLHASGVLISDNADETKLGYTLGLEIDCDCFENVLKCMMVAHRVPFDIQDNLVANENLHGFKTEFMRCMNNLEPFAKEEYTLRDIRDDGVVWLSKRITAMP